VESARSTTCQVASEMSGQSSNLPEIVRAALTSVPTDDSVIQLIADLPSDVFSPELENALLMALSDTSDARLRNVTALALADMGSRDAVPRLVSLLKDRRTKGFRGTLLYALQKLKAVLPITDLAILIVSDTAEAQEEALALLEQSIDGKTDENDLTSAVSILLFGLSQPISMEHRLTVADAFEVCALALTRKLAKSRPAPTGKPRH